MDIEFVYYFCKFLYVIPISSLLVLQALHVFVISFNMITVVDLDPQLDNYRRYPGSKAARDWVDMC